MKTRVELLTRYDAGVYDGAQAGLRTWGVRLSFFMVALSQFDLFFFFLFSSLFLFLNNQ